MHARHRSPGNGYRSSSMGMGVGASRISPDSSARGHGFYNSEYRSFNNRGFGRGQGQAKSFQHPPHPPPRKSDILMEAGRLAAEYLVSKGLLPHSALSGKWQNGSLRKQVGDYQDFRLQEDLTQEGRTSAHARLGSGASDAGSGRRRYLEDSNPRNHVKGRRRGEYYRSYSSELGREHGRSGSWLDRHKASPDVEGENDTVSGHFDEQQVDQNVGDGMQKSGLSGLPPESEETTDIKSGVDNNYLDEMGSKASSSGAGKEEPDEDPSKRSDDFTNTGYGEMRDINYNESEKQIVPEDLTTQHCAMEGDLSGKNGSDLLTLCKFAKVPTKTRSALTHKTSKVGQVPDIGVENASDLEPCKGSEAFVQNGPHDVSKADVLTNMIHDSKCPDSEISEAVAVQSAEDAGELVPPFGTGQDKCVRSHSFPDEAFMHDIDNEREPSQGVPGLGRSSSVKERGEKRALEDSVMNEASKKPREWPPSLVTTADEHVHVPNLIEDRICSQEQALPDQRVIAALTQDNLLNSCQFTRTGGEQCVKYAQEKQLFPSSFKICDLNLMETSDLNDNHPGDPVLMCQSITGTRKLAAQVDIDLSISNSNMSSEYVRHAGDGKEIEVIDLENDSAPEDKAFDNSQRKTETTFPDSEGFPSHAQNVGDISDVQDNYDGLMIPEYLTSFSNCTSVTEDINPMQNDIGLHNGEGTLGDDDSIYMSLGEIPLSFIPAWEQQTPQEYEKPF